MLTVWRRPVSNQIYVLGVDTAEGLAHGHIPPDNLAEEVHMLGLWYNDALCCVESNNHGLTTIVQLRHLGYPNMFRKRSVNKVTNKVSQEFGWKTTRTTKPLLIDDLSMALRNDELTLFDRNTVNELKTYVRNERGTMSGSPFDDRVMALALSNQMRQYAFMPEYAPAADDYWTVDWFKNLIMSEKESPSTRIGSKTVRGTV